MTRRHFTFACAGAQLVGSLDEAPGTSALLLVTGGNEVRSGAWAGQAQFAARIAAAGFPVLRFDRRGCGDSEGINQEFRSSGPDLAAARAALAEQCPHVTRIVALGNCDAASALMLDAGAGCDALVLCNPWTFGDDAGDEAPPEVMRDHYRRRLADPAAIKRLLTGRIALGPLLSSLFAAARTSTPPSTLAQAMAEGLGGFDGLVRILVATRDRTGQAFLATWSKSDPRMRICADATHSWVEDHAREWLVAQTLEVLRG